MIILGTHEGHDASAALLIDGEIVASIAEERLSRIKHDSLFPYRAVAKCLEMGGVDAADVDVLAIPSPYVPPTYRSFFRMPESAPSEAAQRVGYLARLKRRFMGAPPLPPGKPFELPLYQRQFELSPSCTIHLCEHHRAHAASAYYTSGLSEERTLIVTMDGVGGSVSGAMWIGEKGRIEERYRVDGSGSLGWFYSNVTEALGWRHGSGEWKVMGLAPYGRPVPGLYDGLHPEYENGHLKTAHDFGMFSLWNDRGVLHYHGSDVPRIVEAIAKVSREDAAAEAQRVVEEEAFRFIRPWIDKERVHHICCAGGFFLNVKLNQKLWYSGSLDRQWVFPDCGDGGLAVGAALDAHFKLTKQSEIGTLEHVYLGPEFSRKEIREILNERGIDYREVDEPAVETARHLAANRVVGWFQGRMECGPRALGNRSILMSPLKRENKDIINAKVKYREKFRPFCPSMLAEARDRYLVGARDEHFMVTSFVVKEEKRAAIPAVVHEDQTARPQLVRKNINLLYHTLIREFAEITGEAAILNTSFNIRGEPIVCHPREAIRCFYDTGLDVLVLDNFIIEKKAVPSDNPSDSIG